MRLSRLSGRKVCERVKTKGMLWKGKHLQARFLRGAPRGLPPDAVPTLRVGVVTSAKLDKSAVRRNRMRRRCREALRLLCSELQSSQKSPVQLLTKNESREATGLAGPGAGAHLLRKGGLTGGTPGVALPSSVQLILLPRSSSLTAPFDELLLDARRFLSSLSA